MRSAALGLAVAVGITTQGAPTAAAGTATTTVTKQKTTATVGSKKAVAAAGVAASNPNEIGLLDQAYGLLRTADHDYKGHRVHAMHAIEAAARELGGRLSGGGKAGEAQATSDSHLKSAQSLLQQAVSGLAGKPLRHVQVAISQLSVALSIK